jgi:hypothetical protein
VVGRFFMQRYHLPIIVLALVSTFVVYLVVTQRSPFITDSFNGTITLDISSIAFFLISTFLALFSWLTLISYTILHLRKPLESPRLQTRTGVKWALVLATGLCAMIFLQISNTLNIVTGSLLWITLAAIIWSTRPKANTPE